MSHIQRVDIDDSVEYLLKDLSSSFLSEMISVAQLMVELHPAQVFLHEVQIVPILVMINKLHQIRMIKFLECFEFTEDVLHVVLV